MKTRPHCASIGKEPTLSLPSIVSMDEWKAARERLLLREKEITHARAALAAERRRMPMVMVEKDYRLHGPEGEVSLLELFASRRQLVVYHFMFAPEWDAGCDGCSMVADSVGHPAHLHARDTSFVMVSRAPLEKLEAFKARMDWTIPWYSSFGTDFNRDFGATTDDGEEHGLSVFLRDGDAIYQTYHTADRGIEHLLFHYNVLDLTPLGRQEEWEDSPPGWPQTDTYAWGRLHDEYEDDGA
jgi:predicted dithiol-disulfide oxidoreductase (DUF899 family)